MQGYLLAISIEIHREILREKNPYLYTISKGRVKNVNNRKCSVFRAYKRL